MLIKESLNTQESNEESHRAGLYYIITAQVFEDERLKDDDCMLYALISGLALNSGYCFASDAYLQKRRKKKSLREIQRSLEDLEKLGYIRRETKRKGMQWERKIFVCHARISNNSYERTYVSPAKRQGCRVESDADGEIVSKEILSKDLSCSVTHATRESENSNISYESNSSPPPNKEISGSFSKKKSDGSEIRFDQNEIFRLAIRNHPDWTTSEIEFAIQAAMDCQGPINTVEGFLAGTIQNLRNKINLQKRTKCKKQKLTREKTTSYKEEPKSLEKLSSQPMDPDMLKRLFPHL